MKAFCPGQTLYLSTAGRWESVPLNQVGAISYDALNKLAQRAPGSRTEPFVLFRGRWYEVEDDVATTLEEAGFGQWFRELPPTVTRKERVTPPVIHTPTGEEVAELRARIEALEAQVARKKKRAATS